jgi:small subunit ribosomal protein S20
MPNINSAKKRMRQNARLRVHNRAKKSRLFTTEKAFRSALADGDFEAAATTLNLANSLYDKAAKTNTIHANRANRKKSQLTQAYQAALAAAK